MPDEQCPISCRSICAIQLRLRNWRPDRRHRARRAFRESCRRDPVRHGLVIDAKRPRDLPARLSAHVHLRGLRAQIGRIPESPVLLDIVALTVLALVTLVAVYGQPCLGLTMAMATVRADGL